MAGTLLGQASSRQDVELCQVRFLEMRWRNDPLHTITPVSEERIRVLGGTGKLSAPTQSASSRVSAEGYFMRACRPELGYCDSVLQFTRAPGPGVSFARATMRSSGVWYAPSLNLGAPAGGTYGGRDPVLIKYKPGLAVSSPLAIRSSSGVQNLSTFELHRARYWEARRIVERPWAFTAAKIWRSSSDLLRPAITPPVVFGRTVLRSDSPRRTS